MVLGVWLLGIALLFALRPAASIRTIPITLATLVALTLYGPASLTRLSISSQGHCLACMLGSRDITAVGRGEASAGLRPGALALTRLIGHREAGTVVVNHWSGWLLLRQ